MYLESLFVGKGKESEYKEGGRQDETFINAIGLRDFCSFHRGKKSEFSIGDPPD